MKLLTNILQRNLSVTRYREQIAVELGAVDGENAAEPGLADIECKLHHENRKKCIVSHSMRPKQIGSMQSTIADINVLKPLRRHQMIYSR